VRSIDPMALLEPIDTALAEFRRLLSSVDLTETLLGPLEEGFSVITDRLAELDPAALLEPAREELDTVREDIAATLRLDAWVDAATTAREWVDEHLAVIDPSAFAAALSEEVGQRLRDAIPETPNVLGALVAALAQATGLPAEATGMAEVLSWFRGTDGRAVVEARLDAVAADVGIARVAIAELDPAPLVAAAEAHHRALLDAVRSHPSGSDLRGALEPVLLGTRPADVLAPLGPNCARVRLRIDGDAATADRLAATGFSHVNATTDGLQDALAPLGSVLEWARSLLQRLGLTVEGGPLGALLGVWLEQAGPHRVVPPLVELVEAIRDKVGEIVAAALVPVETTATSVADALGVLDLAPVIDGIRAVHAEVLAEVESLSPTALLGPTVSAVDDVVDQLEAFDPLAPVRAVIDELRATVDEVFDTLRPSVVFADVVTIYTTVVDAAQGLDVRGLLDPVIAALEDLAGQLGVGLEEVATALGRLQDALPDSVSESGVSGSVSVDVGVSL
jgi:hypothetical protein